MNDLIGSLQPLMDKSPELLVTYAVKIILALVVYIAGKWVAGFVSRFIGNTIKARGVDATVAIFTKNIIYYALLVVVVIAALGQLGIQTASFVAIIGAAGLAIGFALQGSLSNFASGIMIILFRPFKNGDFVEAGGTAGVIKEISIFSTILKTPDNKTVIVSNSSITGNNIINYSTEATRRVDITAGISYGSNIKLAKETLHEIAKSEERILKDQDVTVAVAELADSSVNIVFRVWVNTPDFWPVKFDLTEAIKLRFDEKGIEIPFPQMDIHLSKEESSAA